jgi:hypothetical protein
VREIRIQEQEAESNRSIFNKPMSFYRVPFLHPATNIILTDITLPSEIGNTSDVIDLQVWTRVPLPSRQPIRPSHDSMTGLNALEC